jgi:hypothetical protein
LWPEFEVSEMARNQRIRLYSSSFGSLQCSGYLIGLQQVMAPGRFNSLGPVDSHIVQ